MKHVPNEIIENILIEFLNDGSVCYFAHANKEMRNLLMKDISKRFIFSCFPLRLVNDIGFQKVYSLHVLNIKNRCGKTDYIDFITRADFPTNVKCVRGRDIYRRSFISILHENGVLTLFQRYTDSFNYWTHGGKLPLSDDFTSGGISFQNESFLLDNRYTYFQEIIR